MAERGDILDAVAINIGTQQGGGLPLCERASLSKANESRALVTAAGQRQDRQEEKKEGGRRTGSFQEVQPTLTFGRISHPRMGAESRGTPSRSSSTACGRQSLYSTSSIDVITSMRT